MKVKHLNFVEKHIEKVILAVAVLIIAAVLMFKFLGAVLGNTGFEIGLFIPEFLFLGRVMLDDDIFHSFGAGHGGFLTHERSRRAEGIARHMPEG